MGDALAEFFHRSAVNFQVTGMGIRQRNGVSEINQLPQALGELPVGDLDVSYCEIGQKPNKSGTAQ